MVAEYGGPEAVSRLLAGRDVSDGFTTYGNTAETD